MEEGGTEKVIFRLKTVKKKFFIIFCLPLRLSMKKSLPTPRNVPRVWQNVPRLFRNLCQDKHNELNLDYLSIVLSYFKKKKKKKAENVSNVLIS